MGNLPLDIEPYIKLGKHSSLVRVAIKRAEGGCGGGSGRSEQKINKVLLEIPFPSETLSFSLTSDYGKVLQDEVTKVVKWSIGRFPKDKQIVLKGSVTMPSEWEGCTSPNIRVGFEIKDLSLSDLRVDKLAVHNVTYSPFKGVRYITKAGVFLIRS